MSVCQFHFFSETAEHIWLKFYIGLCKLKVQRSKYSTVPNKRPPPPAYNF